MSRDECKSLESFARSLGVCFETQQTREGYIVFAGRPGNARYQGFEEFWDAMREVVLSPSTETGWRESGMLN